MKHHKLQKTDEISELRCIINFKQSLHNNPEFEETKYKTKKN